MKIIGQKINLRSPQASDAKSIYQNINNKAILSYLLAPIPYHLSDTKKFIIRIQKKLKKKEAYTFGIEDKNSKQIIGIISLNNISQEHKYAELGYWLGQKYHRQGIMSEALSLVLDFAFKKIKLNCVWAGTIEKNIASQKLLKKYGFKSAGNMKKFLKINQRWHDDLRWQLLKDDYKK